MLARSLKLLHELGSTGTLGSVVVCLLLLKLHEHGSEAEYAAASGHVAEIIRLVLMPSFVAVLLSGLLGIAATPGFVNAGWVWCKALLGLSLFEASLTLSGNSRHAAELSLQAAAGANVLGQLAQATRTERGVLWVLLGISIANIVLGVWRPRLGRKSQAHQSA